MGCQTYYFIVHELLNTMQERFSNKDWLTAKETQEYLGISESTLRRWDKKGYLKVRRTPTNFRRYSKSEVLAIYQQK